MGEFILMPKLDMSMEEGIITRWLYKEGDRIKKGEGVVEIETGKVNLEVEALLSGVLLKKYAFENDTVKVNKPIAYIGEEGEEIPEVIKTNYNEETEDVIDKIEKE